MIHQNQIRLPKKPDKSFMKHMAYRESQADSPLGSHHSKKICDKYNTKEFSHSATSRSLPLLKKLVTSLSISVCSNSSKPTESYRYTSPTVEHSLKSFSQKISNDNISHPKEPTEPQLSHSRKPSKLTFDCHSCVTKPIKTIHQYLNTNKSLTKSHVSKSRPGSIIELTPLSQLIVQSYRDIEMLRVVHAAQGSGVEGKKHSGRRELNLFRGIIPKDETGKEVDLTKVEANLKKFEELYAQFLKGNQNESNPVNEVHLVAVACKRSEVITGFIRAPTQTVMKTPAH